MGKSIYVLAACFIICGTVYSENRELDGITKNPDGTISISTDIFKRANASSAGPVKIADDPSKPLSERLKLLVNKLGSTVPPQEQSAARNKIIRIGKDAVPYLNISLNSDKRTYTRIQIANILGSFKDESSLASLESAAGSQYITLRKAAIKNIELIGGPTAVEALKRLEGATADGETKNDIQNALSAINK